MSKTADSQIEQQQTADRLRALRDDPATKAYAERIVQKMIDEAEIDTPWSDGQTDEGMLRLALHRACLSLAVCERDNAVALIEQMPKFHLAPSYSHVGKWFAYVEDTDVAEYGNTPEEVVRAVYAKWVAGEADRKTKAEILAPALSYAGCVGAPPWVPQSDVIESEMRDAG